MAQQLASVDGSFWGSEQGWGSDAGSFSYNYSDGFSSGPGNYYSHGQNYGGNGAIVVKYANNLAGIDIWSGGSGSRHSWGSGGYLQSGNQNMVASITFTQTRTVRVIGDTIITLSPGASDGYSASSSMSLYGADGALFQYARTAPGSDTFDQVITFAPGTYGFNMYSYATPATTLMSVKAENRLRIIPVPEPGSMLALGAGLAAVVKRSKKRGAR
jgi:hypothetical protein